MNTQCPESETLKLLKIEQNFSSFSKVRQGIKMCFAMLCELFKYVVIFQFFDMLREMYHAVNMTMEENENYEVDSDYEYVVYFMCDFCNRYHQHHHFRDLA